MSFFIITFFASLVALIGFTGYRIWQLRTGLVMPEDGMHSASSEFPQIDLDQATRHLEISGREWSRWLVLFLLKISVKVTYFIKKRLDAIVTKAYKAVRRQEQEIRLLRENQEHMNFLNTIGEFKKGIKHKGSHVHE